MPSTIETRLLEDMKAAMKGGEPAKLTLSVIRMARAAMQNAAIDKRHELSDAEAVEVLARETKQRRDDVEEFTRLGKLETAATLKAEIAILERYLPQQLSDDELRRIIGEAIAATAATSKRDMGKVMGKVMPQTRGRADGRRVNELVNALLPDA